MTRPAALFALLLFVVPQSQAPRRAPAERPVPFAVGERLTYDISWSSFLTAGTATVLVKEKKASFNSVAYYMTVEGKPTPFVNALYPVYYKADTLVDAYTLLPQWASIFSQERGKQQMKVTMFDQQRHTARFDIRSGATASRQMSIPPYTQDPVSALYWIRTLDLRPGLKTTVPVSYNGNLLTVQVTVNGRETLGGGSGARRAWRVTPLVVNDSSDSAPRKMAVWLSDDNRHVPLRMEVEIAVGRFEMVLTGAR
ncbi:MAG: DUF3108 domain-containing protein [Bacteroidales bacterium]